MCIRSFFPSIAVSFSSSFFHLIPNKTRRGRRTKEENSTDCTVCADRFIQAKMMNLSQTLFALSQQLLYHAACGHHVMYSRPSLSLSLSALCINNNSDKKVKYFFRSIDTSSVDWRLWLTVYSHSSSHGIRCWANSLTDGDRPPYRAGAVAFFLFLFYFILKYVHM